jgi:hypothetical protein
MVIPCSFPGGGSTVQKTEKYNVLSCTPNVHRTLSGSAAPGCGEGDATYYGEQRGVSRHLQAELNGLLQRDGAKPVTAATRSQ